MYIVVFVTAKSAREANKIAEACVKGKLVACANVVKGMDSIFWWDGKINKENEVMVVMKSQKKLFKRIRSRFGSSLLNPFGAVFTANSCTKSPKASLNFFSFMILRMREASISNSFLIRSRSAGSGEKNPPAINDFPGSSRR